MPLATFPIPVKDPKFSSPNKFGVTDQIFNAIVNSANGGILSPSITGINNFATGNSFQGQWSKVGNVVTMNGLVEIQAAVGATLTTIRISLPIVSDLQFEYNGGGIAVCKTALGVSAVIYPDTVNNAMYLEFTSPDTALNKFYYTFSYLVQ